MSFSRCSILFSQLNLFSSGFSLLNIVFGWCSPKYELSPTSPSPSLHAGPDPHSIINHLETYFWKISVLWWNPMPTTSALFRYSEMWRLRLGHQKSEEVTANEAIKILWRGKSIKIDPNSPSCLNCGQWYYDRFEGGISNCLLLFAICFNLLIKLYIPDCSRCR